MLAVLLIFSIHSLQFSETATTRLEIPPSNPSFAVEGQDIRLVWTYTLDGTVGVATFDTTTGGSSDRIGSTTAPGSVIIVSKYQPRFSGQVSNTQAELTIRTVKRSDQGKYQFTLVATGGGSLSAEVEVIVQFQPKITFVNQSAITVDEHLSLVLLCEASGFPNPNITWTRLYGNGSEVEAHKGNVWQIVTISRDFNGTYNCKADNGIGRADTQTIEIIVHFTPSTEVQSEYYVGRQQAASLYCQVEGNPTPSISWAPCNPSDLSCDKSFLNISEVQTPRANYTCTANNILGNDSSTTILIIGGTTVYLRLSTNEGCTGSGDYESVWKELKDEVSKAFAMVESYIDAELLEVRCGSLIFDVVLKFNTSVAEDFVIPTLQNAIVNGKLGEISINASSIIGIPPVIEGTTGPPTGKTTPGSDGCPGCWCNCTILIVVTVILVAIIVGLLAYIIWLHRRVADWKKRTYKKPYCDTGTRNPGVELGELHCPRPSPTDNSQSGQYAPLNPLTRSWEIPRDQVSIEKIIGKGAFGQVAKAKAEGLRGMPKKTLVAVKMLKAAAPESDKKDLLSELEMMKTLKPHPNVIKLMGCVTESEPLLVLIEYIPYGDLLGYLRKSRGLNDTYYKDPDIKPQTSLTSQQLMKFAWQIADGMKYLSSRSIIHRDLAARNVLVGERETCKVTDFGMARDVRQENIYERKTKGRLPVKWTAYEALMYGTYTTKSDVWSYGVLLYEIFTIGGSPYPRMDGRKIANLLQQGYRMPKPQHVDDELYKIMTMCWQEDPNARPTFLDLKGKLKSMQNQHKRLINMDIYDNTQLYANVEDLVV